MWFSRVPFYVYFIIFLFIYIFFFLVKTIAASKYYDKKYIVFYLIATWRIFKLCLIFFLNITPPSLSMVLKCSVYVIIHVNNSSIHVESHDRALLVLLFIFTYWSKICYVICVCCLTRTTTDTNVQDHCSR